MIDAVYMNSFMASSVMKRRGAMEGTVGRTRTPLLPRRFRRSSLKMA
jgi:hypothetical protein